jgi:hypothetical protein
VPLVRGLPAYVVLLLLGFVAGVTLGHHGKLLSLSLWVWWPPGPRPKQEHLYPRRLWLAGAGAFSAGVELAAAGAYWTSATVVRVGAVLVLVASVVAVAGAAVTWSRRPRLH